MRSKNLLLLKTLLTSTSLNNQRKYGKDKKKKKRIVGSYVGITVLLLMFMAYSVLIAIGIGAAGLSEYIPLLSALCVSGIAFFFTVFKVNGYLFNFKEYDMLMALPFEVKEICACRFLYMYAKSLYWYLSVSVSMMIGYGIFAKPPIYVYVVWIILSFFVPVIPMLISTFIGFLIAKVSSGFEKKNIIQTVITIIFVVFCYSLQFIIDAIFKNNTPMEVAQKAADITADMGTYYFPAVWFSNAVTGFSKSFFGGFLWTILFMGVSVGLFLLVFVPISKYYRRINSALKSETTKRNFKMTGQKRRSVIQAVAFKEFRRFTGSTTYFVNGGLGYILTLILSVAVLIVGLDKVVYFITKGAPVPLEILYPAIPFIVYFFVGMMTTTACSLSLEGKNYWILQSLPIEKKTIYHGKILFQLYLSVPSMIIGILCFSVSAGVGAFDLILYLVLGILLCIFSAVYGCVCGIKFMRLDWENEVEVVKQGAAVALYMLPNMFVDMGLVVLVVYLGTFINQTVILLIAALIVAALTALCYGRMLSLIKK